jgi:uncharacterized metal-binding protein
MPELPQKKVGIIACSGEELPEGTITRLAALKVLEQLRPGDTVTICLPLFLAGGEGDRAFAKFYPTITIDGCEKRCAYRGTEMYSNKPTASIILTDLISEHGLGKPEGLRQLNPAGVRAVELTAEQIAAQVDTILGKAWSRREGRFNQPDQTEETIATCSCGSGIPIQKVRVAGRDVNIIALPLIFETFWDEHKPPCDAIASEIMDMVKIYNDIEPADESGVFKAISHAYATYCQKHELSHE